MLVEGLIIIVDLDRFEEFMESKGWNPYKPNIVTGTLTALIQNFVSKWNGVVVYGLDPERGTEEAVIEIPYGHEFVGDIRRDLEMIKNEINKLGASISIVVIKDYVLGKPASTRREAYYGSPGRRRAVKLLKQVKRRGGNSLLVLT